MRIPPFLVAAYSADEQLNAFTTYVVAQVDRHVTPNRMVFFPEYTDHSVEHIELTLQTALDLATDEAKLLMTPQDGAVLTASVLLHDIGMYLSRDGFESLISPDSSWTGIAPLDSVSWSNLWDQFYAEASRFDDRKLRSLFGPDYRPVRPLPKNTAAWEDFDYLLVGEFLRRHHPRLAHEIAIYGMPAKDGGSVPFCATANEDQRFLADIAGLVARSHGMNLRACLDYLEQRYQNKIDPRRVHASFLAVLLRIADYFQIQASRAPSGRTDVARFQSQISEREWKVHQSIRDIHNTGGDPEALVIIAEPPEVNTFLRLRSWIEGLQKELDISWAVLGEVFGLQAHNNLNKLGLRIRRVRSNTDDTLTFATSINYVPERIVFEAASNDLLKLLIEPLYGTNASIGLRELIQNAVDAVREKADLRQGVVLRDEPYELQADVQVEVRCDSSGSPLEIIVTDRGVGMTVEVVRDYFLRAGASFRKSDAWRQEHEDEAGHSRIYRSGRFGVGVLAAFLLGDHVEVTTRSVFVTSGEGVRFSAMLDTEAISLTKVSCPTGTRITISIPESRRKIVKRIVPEKWTTEIEFYSEIGIYFLKRPSLEWRFSHLSRRLLPEEWLPQPDDKATKEWRRFSAPNFEAVFWNYGKYAPELACNGIVVNDGLRINSGGIVLNDRKISAPNLSVFDKDGYLPLNLQRTGLQGRKIPFERELLESITNDLVAYGLVDGPSECGGGWLHGSYEGFKRRELHFEDTAARWLVCRDGFILHDAGLLDGLKAERAVVAVGGVKGYGPLGESLRPFLGIGDILSSVAPGGFSGREGRVKGRFREALNFVFQGLEFQPEPRAIYVPKALVDRLGHMRPGRQLRLILNQIAQWDEVGDWLIDPGRKGVPSAIEEGIIRSQVDSTDPTVFCVGDLGVPKRRDGGVVAERWRRLLPEMVIYFDAARRAEQRGHAESLIGEDLRIREEIAADRRRKGSTGNGDDEEEDGYVA